MFFRASFVLLSKSRRVTWFYSLKLLNFFVLSLLLIFFFLRTYRLVRLQRSSFGMQTCASPRVRYRLTRRFRTIKTIQKAPMAHRQYSQEQYSVAFHRLYLRVVFPLTPALTLTHAELRYSDIMLAYILLLSSPRFLLARLDIGVRFIFFIRLS